MRRPFATRATKTPPHLAAGSLASRVVALLCLLLVSLASTAQAVHTHGTGLPQRQAHVGKLQTGIAPADESVCPLCVAMHSALPASGSPVQLRLSLHAAEPAPWTLVFLTEPQHFAGFSRPPPAAAVLLG